jgi:glycosyltransferase involved in cell wall biosynthesis
MKTLLMIGAADVNGRKAGGVSSIVKQLSTSNDLFRQNGLDLSFQNSCLIQRSNESIGSLGIKNFRNAFALEKRIRTLIFEHHYDYVLIHSSVSFALAKDLWIIEKNKRRFPKTKFCIEVHSSDPKAILSKRFLLRRFLLKKLRIVPDGVVFLSELTKNYFINANFYESKLCCLYNFIPVLPNETALHHKLERMKASNKISLLYLGAIYQEKGFYELIEALNSVSFDYELTVCGEPRNEVEKNRFLKAIEGNNHIVYKGFVSGEEKQEIFLKTDVMVLPSYSEGLPVSLLEGMSYGCYLIASNVGSIPEVFSNAGEIIDGHSPSLIKAALEKCTDKSLVLDVAKRNIVNSKAFTVDSYIRGLSSFLFKL